MRSWRNISRPAPKSCSTRCAMPTMPSVRSGNRSSTPRCTFAAASWGRTTPVCWLKPSTWPCRVPHRNAVRSAPETASPATSAVASLHAPRRLIAAPVLPLRPHSCRDVTSGRDGGPAPRHRRQLGVRQVLLPPCPNGGKEVMNGRDGALDRFRIDDGGSDYRRGQCENDPERHLA